MPYSLFIQIKTYRGSGRIKTHQFLFVTFLDAWPHPCPFVCPALATVTLEPLNTCVQASGSITAFLVGMTWFSPTIVTGPVGGSFLFCVEAIQKPLGRIFHFVEHFMVLSHSLSNRFNSSLISLSYFFKFRSPPINNAAAK